jgi:hypothetical protein
MGKENQLPQREEGKVLQNRFSLESRKDLGKSGLFGTILVFHALF